MSDRTLLTNHPKGIYCPQAGVWLDAKRKVPQCLISHAHADHAIRGHGTYICTPLTARILTARLGRIKVHTYDYGVPFKLGAVQVSFHPAGHIPGSAQIRLEYKDQVWVYTGDFKPEPDGISTPFKSLTCTHLLMESTFGLPLYHWPPEEQQVARILDWWEYCHKHGRVPVLFSYSLGKAQRMMHLLQNGPGPIWVNGPTQTMNLVLRRSGVPLPSTRIIKKSLRYDQILEGLLLLPPGASKGLPALPYSTAMASGWTQSGRGLGNSATGFIISDHADYPGLLQTAKASGAEQVFLTHGFEQELAQSLRAEGIQAEPWSAQSQAHA